MVNPQKGLWGRRSSLLLIYFGRGALLLTIQVTDFPSVPEVERVKFEELGEGFHRVLAHYGFMETPNVPQIMEKAQVAGIIPNLHAISCYPGRETLTTSKASKVLRWRKGLLRFLSRNSRSAVDYFGIPPQPGG